jgi:hypothetical protein
MVRTLPFSDANEPEVLARVAYQLILRDYASAPYKPERAPQEISVLAKDIQLDYSWKLGGYIAAYGFHIGRGLNSGLVRTMMVQRSRMGCTWRECMMFSYKANRRRLPPC